MSDELTNDQISQWLEVAAPCLFAAWQYGQTPDDADPVAWFAEVYGQGAPGPVHAVHVVGDDGRTVAVTGNGPRSAAHAKFMAWSSPGNVSTLLRDFRAMRDRAIAAERLLADERAANAETSHNLDALLTALGAQVTPGGQTMDACDARRVADGMRRARSEVPADVEAAIVSLVAAARDATNYEPDRTTAAKHLAAERSVKEEIAKLRAAIAAEIKRARAEFDHARSVFFEDMLRRRDITSPCQECEGYGVRAYPSTATWHRGAGGQMVTSDVCDRCWGSGDAVKRGVDLRKMASAASALPPIDDDAQELIDGLVAANRPASGKRTKIAPAAPATVARPISEWHEDIGAALWWRLPVEEPPYSGTPLNSDWPGYHTHWTPIVCPDDPPSESPAAPATVGGLLATAPIGAVVEWLSEDHEGWCRTTAGQSQMVISRWFEYPPKWTRPGFGMYPGDLRLPARIVPADQADADPASRGPIGGGS